MWKFAQFKSFRIWVADGELRLREWGTCGSVADHIHRITSGCDCRFWDGGESGDVRGVRAMSGTEVRPVWVSFLGGC